MIIARKLKIITVCGMGLLGLYFGLFYHSGGQAPTSHDFEGANFVVPTHNTIQESEWLARAKYEMRTQEMDATVDDQIEYFQFIQEYAIQRLKMLANQPGSLNVLP